MTTSISDDARDRTVRGRLRREIARLTERRPAAHGPARAMVSFTFDDIPKSAAEAGAAILDEAGVPGVFFVSGAYADGADGPLGPYAGWDAIRALAASGHEIGCHTYGHRNVARLSPDERLAEIDRNAQAFVDHGLPPATGFAYPFGDLSPAAKRGLGDRFTILRATHPGLLGPSGDLNQAPAVGLEGPNAVQVGAEWLARAKASNGWLILMIHDVSEAPSQFGCTPAAMRATVKQAAEMEIEVVTLAEGARRVSATPDS